MPRCHHRLVTADQVPDNDAYLAKLREALAVLGGRAQLCQALWISVQDLDRYLSGIDPIPFEIYVVAIDIVSRGRR